MVTSAMLTAPRLLMSCSFSDVVERKVRNYVATRNIAKWKRVVPSDAAHSCEFQRGVDHTWPRLCCEKQLEACAVRNLPICYDMWPELPRDGEWKLCRSLSPCDALRPFAGTHRCLASDRWPRGTQGFWVRVESLPSGMGYCVPSRLPALAPALPTLASGPPTLASGFPHASLRD